MKQYEDGVRLAGVVSRTLGQRSSHVKSVEHGTRIRGYRLRSTGYRVTALPDRRDGRVRCTVTHEMSSDAKAYGDRAKIRDRQNRLTEAYREYVNEHGPDGWLVGPVQYGDLYGYAWFVVEAARSW